MSQFISYAQNYEDVMLWRALGHIRQGYYVDVGANGPEFHSVTHAFYKVGWRGINIEPMQVYFEALERERPGDINLRCAAGAQEGEITFYEVPETGDSSAAPDVVEALKAIPNREGREIRVPLRTLNSILEEYAPAAIHFLKIDVEGYEREVIEGLDLARWRPWVLVIEATVPNSSEIKPNFPLEQITSAGYRCVYFDGLNRFFVADEHAELAEAFSVPPNVFDAFVPARLAASEEQAQDLWQQTITMGGELEWHRGNTAFLRQEIERIHAQQQGNTAFLQEQVERGHTMLAFERARLEGELATLRGQIERERSAMHAEAAELRAQYVNILYSQSYRITAPLRALFLMAQRIKNRLRGVPTRSQENVVSPTQITVSTEAAELGEVAQYYLTFFQREIQTRRRKQKESKP